MGPCQGRICGWTLAHYAARHLGVTPREIGVNEPRVPVKPLAVSAIIGRGKENMAEIDGFGSGRPRVGTTHAKDRWSG